jgi:predicted nucleic acid-binding protein
LAFCRLTQLGLLRLLTTKVVMGDEVMTQPQAWAAYDQWLQDPRVEFLDEPTALEARFRSLTRLRQPATKDWADSYLAAFATVGQLTLVTFDRGLRTKVKSIVVLGSPS